MSVPVDAPAPAPGGRPSAQDRASSMAARAYDRLCDRLVMLEIRPGAPINDERVAEELGMGRTPVREALKQLEHERLVVAYPRRGTFATEVHITDLAHISEVRQQLEPVAAQIAAVRASARDRQHLAVLAEDLADGGAAGRATQELMRTDLQVHRALYAATHNPYLEDTLVRYDNLATRIWCLFTDRLPGMAGHVEQHGPLLRAVVDGDGDRARELAAAHVADFEREIRSLL